MKSKGKSTAIFIICTLAIILFAIVCFRGVEIGGWEVKSFNQTITKGLDLQGGVSVLLEITQPNVSHEDLEKTKDLIQLRVNKLGVAETVVTTEGSNRIRVDIPGKYDSEGIVKTLSQTGDLTFVGPDGKVILTGKDVEKASAVIDQQTNQPVVSLKFTSEGTQKFAEATKEFIGQKIAIKMDNETLTDPTVQSQIDNGEAVITGSGSIQAAQNLAGLINSGALPVPIKAVSQQTVGAQLGATALPNAVKAGIIGVGIVFLFMILYYRIPGLIASIALTFYVTLVLLAFVEIGVTLTLPGIAGLLLTIGMAVDANVLIFERTKEELARGVTVKSAIKRGYQNAMSSIVDSNMTTIIAALILYFFGSGSVKGFAITLMIGIIISLFTGLLVTKFLLDLAYDMGILKKLSAFRVKKEVKENA
ncbi:protein translocase subunit SecD [Clostridium thermobutyricum]|uniref:protein translocase subunit SecD n=1 Tax=Clostridium thermobutyricum TaxID=29372 RepID=UPI0029438225|nr:protein translocase subunit SecD [Clostridium thermobutyricum]